MKKIFSILAISLMFVNLNYGQNMKLVVGDQIKIKGGTPGANKLLTSNANGLASWSSLDSLIGATSFDSLAGEGYRLNSASTNTYKMLFADQNGNIVSRVGHDCEQSYLLPFPWTLGGNSLPVGSPNYIGTCNEYPFRLFANGQERMRIATDGKVGIGTTTPQYSLDVRGTTGEGRVSIGGSDLVLGKYDGREQGVNTGNRALVHDGWEEGKDNLIINYNGDFDDGVHIMAPLYPSVAPSLVIDGKVGIGTAICYHILDVEGAVVIGSIYAGSPIVAPTDGLLVEGSVGIGTNNFAKYVDHVPTTNYYKLAVNGKVHAEEVVVNTIWSDFVFDKNYKLISLYEVEQYINEHKHLPDVPSADEVAESGIAVGQNQSVLLQKIEELTLYIIEQNKKIEEQNKRIEALETKNK